MLFGCDLRSVRKWAKPAPWLAVAVLGLAAYGCVSNDNPPSFAVGSSPPVTRIGRVDVPPPSPASPPERAWRDIRKDGVHDPTNPALEQLQQPASALSELPVAGEGNQVDWVAALRGDYISPRTNIFPETNVNVLDLDILMTQTAGMAMVRFPHRQHTEWLDCVNCHEKIFISKAGANKVRMLDILQGKFCGQCHGAVSFPLTQCHRCHSVVRSDVANEKSPP